MAPFWWSDRSRRGRCLGGECVAGFTAGPKRRYSPRPTFGGVYLEESSTNRVRRGTGGARSWRLSCESPPTADIVPVPVADPMAINYGEQCNESQRVEKITITNSTGGNLSMALSIVGNDAGFFTVEPTSLSLLGSGASRTVDVTYHPSDELGGGSSQLGMRHQAILRATYAGAKDATASLDIELGGEVARTTVAPKISFTCLPDGDGVALPRCSQNPDGVPCCSTYDPGDGSKRFETLGFGSPRIGDTAVLPLRVENLGCAPLAVESIVINTQVSNCGADVVPPLDVQAFSLEQGASHDFALRFTPDAECNFVGQLVVTPEEGDAAKSSVLGNGRESKLRVSDTELAFGEVIPARSSPGISPSAIGVRCRSLSRRSRW